MVKPTAPSSAFLILLFALPAWIGPGPIAPAELAAQVVRTGGALPQDVREEALAFLNDPRTLRVAGGTRIPLGTRLEGPLGVLGGELRVAGTVDGPIVVVNGDLTVVRGGRVEGPVLVIGGRVTVEEDGTIGDDVRQYSAPLRFRIRGDRIEDDEPRLGELPPLLQADLGFAILRPTLRSAGNYNRIEGLPFYLGPVFETTGRNPTRLKAFALWRSVSGVELDRENLGHRILVEQELGGSGEGRAGFELHSRTNPIEERGLTGPEASLSTFLLHRDVRDYYDAEGWSTYLELNPLHRPIRARLEYLEEDHAPARVRNPWTLRDRDGQWRPQSLVAEGPVRSIRAGITWDTRDDARDPTFGWWAHGSVRRRVGGDLVLPARVREGTDPAETGEWPEEVFPLATDVELDLRTYNRLGPDTRLNLRLLLAGSVDGNPLPPQFQRSLGGEGSLPGHRRFALDCGARTALVTPGEDPAVHPAYGCDRIGLFQVELKGLLPLAWAPDLERQPVDDVVFELSPGWTVFANVGRGQTVGSDLESDLRIDSPTRADLGAGVHVGPLGVYWAWPLNRRDQGINFFVRLDRRF